jgi:recombinational DNA repair ATPase RecF
MKILSLILENFKGIKNLKVEFNGKNATIFGANAAGKTTLYDAYLWLLFGKDSQGAKDFSVKPIGAPKGVEVAVTGTFEINGNTVTLKKVLKENWVKPRGKLEAEYSGDITQCYVDEVPYKVTDYAAYIQTICDENAFKLLSNPLHFNTQLKWQDRRKLLFDVCGDVSDEIVCQSDKQLAELPALMGKHNFEDFKKILNERRKSINQELELLPVRIDEAAKSIVEVDVATANSQIAKIKQQIETLTTELNKVKSGADEAEANAKVTELKTKLRELINKNDRHILDQMEVHRQRVYALEETVIAERRAKSDEYDRLRREQTNVDADMSRAQYALNAMHQSYKDIDASVWGQPTVCPTCGQAIPEAEIKARQDAFNRDKKAKLDKLTEQSKETAADIEAFKLKKAELDERISALENQLLELDDKKQQIQIDNPLVLRNIANFDGQKAELETAIAEATEKLNEIRNAKAETMQGISAQITNLNTELYAQQDILAKDRQNKELTDRIAEYEQKQKDYIKQHEQNEKALWLCDLFTQRKVAMVTDSINSRFKVARFKLFELQKNGGIADCCEVTVNDVPYSDLNSAMKINVGLDVIQTLQEHFSFAPPVFVDNAETVNQLYKLNSQMIKLRVSEDTKLRVVLDTTESEE